MFYHKPADFIHKLAHLFSVQYAIKLEVMLNAKHLIFIQNAELSGKSFNVNLPIVIRI